MSDEMQVPTREQAYSLDDRAEFPVIIPQWQAADGTQRGVWVKALSYRQRMIAEREAMKAGGGKVNEWLLVAHETAAGITRPAGYTPDALLDWNADALLYVHSKIISIGGLSGAVIARELARLAGGDPPEPGGVAGDGHAHPDDVGGDAGPAPGGAT